MRFAILTTVLIIMIFIGFCGQANSGAAEKKAILSKVYSYTDEEIDGMKYRIYFKEASTSETGYCLAVINITKDKLECDLLNKQLAE